MTAWSPQSHVPLSQHTTLKVGGVASYFASVHTLEELQAAVAWARTRKQSVTVLGAGSNVLVSDEGIDGLVLQIALRGRTYAEPVAGTVRATFAAGEQLDSVIAETVERCLWGLENLSHIPGTIGATPIQNVGAYGVEVSDLIDTIDVFDTQTGTIEQWSAQQCAFGYRDSRFKHEPRGRYIVTAVTFRLSVEPRPVLMYGDLRTLASDTELPAQADIRATVCRIRSTKFPDWHTVGTAGSFFKNPIVSTHEAERLRREFPGIPLYEVDDRRVKVALGWVLDQVCGLRGHYRGSVGCYEGQALVLVHQGGVCASDVIAFAEYVTTLVYERTGLEIEWEVTRLS